MPWIIGITTAVLLLLAVRQEISQRDFKKLFGFSPDLNGHPRDPDVSHVRATIADIDREIARLEANLTMINGRSHVEHAEDRAQHYEVNLEYLRGLRKKALKLATQYGYLNAQKVTASPLRAA